MPVLLPTRQQPQSWTHCSSSGGSSTARRSAEWFRRDLTEASTRFISVFRRRVRRSAALCWRTTTQSCCRKIRRRWKGRRRMKLYWGRRNKVGDAHQPEWKQGEEEEEEEERKGNGGRKAGETGRKDWERWSWRLVKLFWRPIHVREAPRAKDLKRVGSTPSSRSSAYLSVVPGVHCSHMSAIAEQNEDL